MFYSQFLLVKKGPLGTIWIAAHLENKLRKNQVLETNISKSVDSIMFPEVPIALRLSGYLLLGVVRIYSKKTNYLFQDCSDALVKLKHAFNPGSVDLPPHASKAPFDAITLPEEYDFEELEFMTDPTTTLYFTEASDAHVTSRDQITLQEPAEDPTFFHTRFSLDERFNNENLDTAFDPHELPKETSNLLEEDILPPMEMDMEIDGAQSPAQRKEPELNLEHSDSQIPLTVSLQEVPDIEKLRSVGEPINDDYMFGHNETINDTTAAVEDATINVEDHRLVEDETPLVAKNAFATPMGISSFAGIPADDDVLGSVLGGTPALRVAPTPVKTVSAKRRKLQDRSVKRKRKVILDDSTILPGNVMKSQLASTSDIRRVRKKVSPPPTQQIEPKDLFDMPSTSGLHPELQRLFQHTFSLPSIKHNENEVKELDMSSIGGDVSLDANPVFSEAGHLEHRQDELRSKTIEDRHLQASDIDHLEDEGQEHRSKFLEDKDTVMTEDFEWMDTEAAGRKEQGREATGREDQETEAIERNDQEAAESTKRKDEETYSKEKEDQETEPLQGEQDNLPERTITQSTEPFVAPQILSTDASAIGNQEAVADAMESNSVHQQADITDTGFLLEDYSTFPEVYNGTELGEDIPKETGRTRAIIQFFKTTFEATNGKKPNAKLSLGGVLKGKTRKEAARMFFETLVLKSNEFIDAVQDAPFSEIYVLPRPKLLKSEF